MATSTVALHNQWHRTHGQATAASSGLSRLQPQAPSAPTITNRPASQQAVDATTHYPPVSRRKQASVLLSAFLTISLTIGYNQTYGVFQEYYLSNSQTLLDPAPASFADPPTALLAFVGTLGAGLTWAGSVFVNPILSRIEHRAAFPSVYLPAGNARRPRWKRVLLATALSPRAITVSGVFLMSLGFLLASFSHTIIQLLLTQGLLYGIGSSLLYFPLLSPAPEYFSTHRATAMGLILSGGGVGGLVFGPVIRISLSKVGGAWTLRAYAIFLLAIGLPVAMSVPRSRFPIGDNTSSSAVLSASEGRRTDTDDVELRPAVEAPARRREDAEERRTTHVPRSLAKRPTFLFSAVAAFLQAAGAALPLSFIPSYTVALGLDASKGATLLAVSNSINAASRVATGYAGDRLGRQNALVLTVGLAMVSIFTFWLGSVSTSSAIPGSNDSAIVASTSGTLWIAFIVIYSIAAGGYYALFPATIAEVFGIRQYAAVNGSILLVRGLGTMFGSPIGGLLLTAGNSMRRTGLVPMDYRSIVFWDGALLLGAALGIVGVRWADAKGRGWVARA